MCTYTAIGEGKPRKVCWNAKLHVAAALIGKMENISRKDELTIDGSSAHIGNNDTTR